jgi:hypothetical protein
MRILDRDEIDALHRGEDLPPRGDTPSRVPPAPAPAAPPVVSPTPAPTPQPTPTPTPATSGEVEEPTATLMPAATEVVTTPEDEQPDQGQTAAEAEDADFDWRPFVPADPNDHVARIKLAAAASGCGVPWELLAAIARVESDFGRNMATSSAGAIGYGQFLPSSWEAFGQAGNAYDYRDALPAIARYLCRHGVARDPRQAIFAYNHADWYVDLVLGLAARYDHLLPDGPTQDMLDLPQGQQPSVPLRFAAGRDAQAQTRPVVDAGGVWLPIAFSGRADAKTSAWESALAMLRGGFGLDDGPSPAPRDLVDLANAAWDEGLDLLGGPGGFHRWSLDDLRAYLRSGQPVVALVHARLLPGHPPDEADVDQPILLLGFIGDHFVYNDPSFASSLGYGLEVSGADLQAAWDRAAPPRRAVAFARRQAATAFEPAPIPTSTPTPAVVAPTVVPTPEPTLAPTEEPLLDEPTPEPLAATAPEVELPEAPPSSPSAPQLAAGLACLMVLGLAALLRRRLPR